MLEIVGILESKVGSGTYIKSSNIDQISMSKIMDISKKEESPYEILEVRKIIEPEIVSLAVKNSTAEDVQEIDNILEKMKSEMNDRRTYSMDTDALFHLRIAQASGNAVLVNVMKYIVDLMREKLWDKIIDGPAVTREDIERDIKFHEDIFYCIKNRDVKRVRTIMINRFNEIQKGIK